MGQCRVLTYKNLTYLLNLQFNAEIDFFCTQNHKTENDQLSSSSNAENRSDDCSKLWLKLDVSTSDINNNGSDVAICVHNNT